MSLTKCTVQRCHGQPSTRAIAAFRLIGDGQAHARQAALLERAQELDPEAAGLDFADIEADHLPHARLAQRVAKARPSPDCA
jgi:hypothetical protein